jgi:hypothetical protein
MDLLQSVRAHGLQLVRACSLLMNSSPCCIALASSALRILSGLSLFASSFCRYLKLNPRDKKSGDDGTEYVSLVLQLDDLSVKPDTVVKASFKLLIYDQAYGKHSEHQGNKLYISVTQSKHRQVNNNIFILFRFSRSCFAYTRMPFPCRRISSFPMILLIN